MGVLENQVASIMQVNLPGSWFWSKDINSHYLGNNTSFGQFFGFRYSNEMIGCSDHELRCEAAAMADTFQKCDRQVMTSDFEFKFFEILKSARHETRIVVVNKIPLLNTDRQVIGTFGHAIDVTEPFFKLGCLLGSEVKSSSKKLAPGSFAVGGALQNKFNLTNRQAECLFYLLRYKTAKQIATILNISVRTVDEHIEKLKYKFNCRYVKELLEKAIHHNFLQFIPDSIFSSQLSLTIE